MAEYAPAAIRSLYDQIAAVYTSAQFAGIIGDQNHSYGYHRGGNYVSGGDYSMYYSQDYNGDGDAACGLDITCASSSEHYALSQALLNTTGNGAMDAIREFYGSVDGWNVIGWDFTGDYPVSSDDSHLWHVHISIHRIYANDQNAMNNVAAAITGHGGGGGGTPPPPSGDRVLIDTYTVQPGDTLTTICYKYPQTDVLPASVAADNGISDPNSIQVGQQLAIYSSQGPGGGGSTPPPAGSPHAGRPWPSYMPHDEWFGDINGPNESHGGYYESEKADVKAIQDQLLWKGYVSGLSYPNSWADGLFEQATVDAVAAFQRAEMPGTQYYGQVWSDDWAKLMT